MTTYLGQSNILFEKKSKRKTFVYITLTLRPLYKLVKMGPICLVTDLDHTSGSQITLRRQIIVLRQYVPKQ
jgi:hypothetical protein